MAFAATALAAAEWRMFYLDWDAHHGDGVEALTADNPDVMTASIHNVPLFPGTGCDDDPDRQVWNYPLERAATGGAMLAALDDAWFGPPSSVPTLCFWRPAHGHRDDPLSALRYEYEHCLGRDEGAGGYQPLMHVRNRGT